MRTEKHYTVKKLSPFSNHRHRQCRADTPMQLGTRVITKYRARQWTGEIVETTTHTNPVSGFTDSYVRVRRDDTGAVRTLLSGHVEPTRNGG